MDPTLLLTHSLRRNAWGDRVGRIMAAALSAVDPANAVEEHVQRAGAMLTAGGMSYDLDQFQRIFLIGAGKAGAPMAETVARLVGPSLKRGIIITKDGYDRHARSTLPDCVEIIPAGHPLPDQRGIDASQRIINMLADIQREDFVICVISGGGSALLTAPYPGITLAELRILTGALIACGASIDEINTLRKHLDCLKGGGLARLAFPATLLSLVLSDVVGSPLEVIASGPAVPDPTLFGDAKAVLQRYNLAEQIPASILEHLNKGAFGDIPETPKPGDAIFERVLNIIVGSNYQAAAAALTQATTEGFHTLLLTTYLEGEARQAGQALAAIARQIDATGQPIPRPACVVAGGETTVTLRGDGLGGRNQELALGAVLELADIPNAALVALATDGGDGPTDAAGAVATGDTLSRARQLGLDPVDFLDRNDAYHFFAPLDDLLRTGPTFTNVNDLELLFLF